MKFKTIGVITKPQAESAKQTLESLFAFLKKKNCTVLLDDQIPDAINSYQFNKCSRKELGEQCDLCIVVGGDGTILNAVRSLAHANVPLLGINVGRLGFLADISPDELENSLSEILGGSYREEQRLLLETQVLRDRRPGVRPGWWRNSQRRSDHHPR